MITIDQNELRRELIVVYQAFIENAHDSFIDQIRQVYDSYHRPADAELLEKDICKAIQALYPIAWNHIAKVSHTKVRSKDYMKTILAELVKENNKRM